MLTINYKKITAFVLSLIILAIIPLSFSLADDPDNNNQYPTTINNPLGAGNSSVNALLLKIMELVSILGVIIVVFFIIYSGYKFVIAGSNADKRKEAKETFYATIIGGAILLGAGIIANVIVGTVKQVGTGMP